MKKNVILFSLLSILNINIFSQNSYEEISAMWDNLLNVNDNEKNYRLPRFLESLSNKVFYDYEIPFSGWIFEKNSELDYLLLAGILPFSNQESILIWLISSENEQSSWIYSKKLDFSRHQITDFRIDIESTHAFSIYINNKKYVDVPDIQIKVLFSKLRHGIPDIEKEEISQAIWGKLKKLLENINYFKHSFSDFEQLATVISTDNKVKICTWNIEYNSGENFFYGGLVINTASKPILYELKDERKSIKNIEQNILEPEKWYGCVYYDILENSYKKNTYYTLIGYNGNNAFTQIKLIDILTFTESSNPSPKFGAQIFTDEFKNNRRLIFEYSKKVAMMLRYDAGKKMIVMDNLASSEPFFQDDFRFFGPDFSYNALIFDKGKWVYFEEIDLRNEK